MRYPWANIVLLVLLIFQWVTGFLGLISGSENLRWILWLHGVGGYAMMAILFWNRIGRTYWQRTAKQRSLSQVTTDY